MSKILSVGKTVRADFEGLELIGKVNYISANSIEVQMTVPFKGVRLSRELQYFTASDRCSYLSEYGVLTARDLLRQIYLNSQKVYLVQDIIRESYPTYLAHKQALSQKLALLHQKYNREEQRISHDELSFEYLEHEYRLHEIDDAIRDTSAKLLLLPDKILRNGDIPLGFVRNALHPLLGLSV